MDFGGISKIVKISKHYDSATPKCTCNDAELFIKLFYIQVIQSKDIQNNKYYDKKKVNLKKGKVRFCLIIDIRKENKDSWLLKQNRKLHVIALQNCVALKLDLSAHQI